VSGVKEMKQKITIIISILFLVGILIYSNVIANPNDHSTDRSDGRIIVDDTYLEEIEKEREMNNYVDNVFINKVKDEFVTLFDIEMNDYMYTEVYQEFNDVDIHYEVEVGDYAPLGFRKDEKGYILFLKNDGWSHLWEIKEENGDWVIVDEKQKQGNVLDMDKIRESAKKEYLAKMKKG
jgi:hypothetical protein